MPDLKALNNIHAVHLTAVLRLSSSLQSLYIRVSILEKFFLKTSLDTS